MVGHVRNVDAAFAKDESDDSPTQTVKKPKTKDESSSESGSEGNKKTEGAYQEHKKNDQRDYVKDIGQARAAALLQRFQANHSYPAPADSQVSPPNDGETKWYRHPDTGCYVLTSGLTSKGKVAKESGAPKYGIARLTTNAHLKKLQRLVHKTMPFGHRVKFRWHVLAYLKKTGKNIEQEASHLCGRSTCFNPDHIVDEDHATILDRQSCHGKIWCVKHSHMIIDLCKHIPKCIRAKFRPELQTACCSSVPGEVRGSMPPSQVSDLQAVSEHSLPRTSPHPALEDDVSPSKALAQGSLDGQEHLDFARPYDELVPTLEVLSDDSLSSDGSSGYNTYSSDESSSSDDPSSSEDSSSGEDEAE